MLLLCTRGSPPSYFLPFAYKGLFLVCFKVLRFLFICSFLNCSREHSFHSSDVELQPMDIVDDIKTHVEVCLVYLEQVIIIVFSLHLGEPLFLDLPMLAYIHCCTSQHSVPLFNCFYWVHIRLVIMWFLIQWLVVLVYLSFLESSCFSWCFSLALGSMEFLIDSMP